MGDRWRGYRDKSRFGERTDLGVSYANFPRTRYFVIRDPETHPHVYLVTPDVDHAFSSAGPNGVVLSLEEMRADPVARPLLEAWLRGDDRAFWRAWDARTVEGEAEDVLFEAARVWGWFADEEGCGSEDVG